MYKNRKESCDFDREFFNIYFAAVEVEKKTFESNGFWTLSYA